MGGGCRGCEKVVNSESERRGRLPHVAKRLRRTDVRTDRRTRRETMWRRRGDSLPPVEGPSPTDSHLDTQQPAMSASLPAAGGEREKKKINSLPGCKSAEKKSRGR